MTDSREVDTAAEEPGPSELGPRRFGTVVAVGLTVLILDQITKEWALRALTGEPPIDVVGSLRFNLAFNTGAAFSFGSGQGIGPWVAAIAIAVIVGLALGATSRMRWGAVATGLIAGGALGNLADRAFRSDDGFMGGGVVDFIDLQWWPVFNVADAGVVVGAVLLVLVSLRMPA